MGSDVGGGGEAGRPLRVFFIPFFATGHMIPLVDIARLFAARGVDSTILVTPANAAIISPTVDSAASAGLPLRTLLYPFPSAEAGLPPGAENLAHIPLAEAHKIDAASPLTAPHHDRLLRLHRPDAVVADTHFPWATFIADDLGIPRISFHAIGVFPVTVLGSLLRNSPHLAVNDDATPFLVPRLPDPIYMVRPELPDFVRSTTAISAAMDTLRAAEAGSLGVVVNSFAEMESAYADYYLEVDGMRTWFVGPVALAYCDDKDAAARGGDGPKAAANRARCLSWLADKEPRSVVYVAFGSWCHFSAAQLKEIASGLEASGHPFLWVVREDGREAEWMPEGFEKRVEKRGLVVRGWAPQVAALGHTAVGGFVTHCGWNSVLEGVSAGLPMVTWPLSTEQFINEKLVVSVLRVGVAASEGFRSTAEAEKVVVGAAEVEKAVRRIMGGGAEAEERRKRARDYGEKARAAVKEGGSSALGLTRLIDDIKAWPKTK